MELDEGPPDHARSTYGRRNIAGERCTTPMSKHTLPTTAATRTPGWGRGREPGSGGLGFPAGDHAEESPQHTTFSPGKINRFFPSTARNLWM